LHENKDFDHTFTDLEFNSKWASSSLENKKQKIIFQQSITAPFLQVFNNSGKANTKGQKYICLEPLGGAPDAINQSSLGKNHFNPVISSKDEPFRMAYKLDAMAIKQKNIFSRFMSFCWTKIKRLFGK
jgi:galactose mutarotase-like enzyme